MNDFWHKTQFFVCYYAYFFLVNNIISGVAIYQKNIAKNCLTFFWFVNVLVSRKKSKKPPQKTKCCIKFLFRNATFLLTKCCCNQVPKRNTNSWFRFGTLCRKLQAKKKQLFLLAKPMHLLQWRLHPLRCQKLICVCGQSWNFSFEPNASSPHYVCNKDNRQVLAVVR